MRGILCAVVHATHLHVIEYCYYFQSTVVDGASDSLMVSLVEGVVYLLIV